MLCFAPLILIGYLFTLHPNSSHVTSMNDPLLEAQTCERGPGLDAKVTSSGMASLQAQYGFAYTAEPWMFIFAPKVGGAILPAHVPELTSPLNFSLSFQTIVRYDDRASVALEYWHQSNAGLGKQNAGLDMLAVMGGWSF